MKKGALILFLSLIAFSSNAQDSSKVEVERQLEQAFEELDLEDDADAGEQLTDFLENLASNPVNINEAGVDELLQIPGVNLITARSIIDYRSQKPFENKEELLEVSGIGQATYLRMSPYVTVGGSESRLRNLYFNPQYWFNDAKTEVITRYQETLEDQDGYLRADTSGGYLGNPVKYYQRFRIQSDHISLNLTQEKDAGEELNGIGDFDYNSWHVALQNNGQLKRFIVGDYSLSFGQGLVLWTGGAFGKGREVISTTSKNERGLRPYSSAQETDFFRGVAATYGEKLEVTGFYSNRPRTASEIGTDTTNFPSSSGFHRTETEVLRRNNINQQTYGARIRLDTRFGLFGATGYSTNFSSFIEGGSSLSDLYDFDGESNSVIGIDYRALIGSSLVFGEFARSENEAIGILGGIQTSISPSTDLSILARNYEKDFQSFLGDGFGERSSLINERGVYVGLAHQINRQYRVSGYFDQYIFEAPVSGATQSTQGYDILGLLEAKFGRAFNSYLLIRSEIKDSEYSVIDDLGREVSLLGEEARSSARLQLEYQVSRKARLRSRVEIVRYQEPGEEAETGFLIYQDLRLIPSRNLQIDARVTLFDTESFDTRVYQFENDLLYVLSNVSLSDQGQRIYVVTKYEPTDWLQLWLKYSVTIVEDAQVLSSGLSEIHGNTRSQIGVQARILLR